MPAVNNWRNNLFRVEKENNCFCQNYKINKWINANIKTLYYYFGEISGNMWDCVGVWARVLVCGRVHRCLTTQAPVITYSIITLMSKRIASVSIQCNVLDIWWLDYDQTVDVDSWIKLYIGHFNLLLYVRIYRIGGNHQVILAIAGLPKMSKIGTYHM